MTEYKFGNKRKAADLTGFSTETLKKYRLIDKSLLENIHWVKVNSRTIRYNLTLLADWIANRGDSAAHRRAIDHYLQSKLSNQRKRPGQTIKLPSE